MKFLLDENGVESVNVALVKKFSVQRIFSEGWEETKYFRVAAEISGEDDAVILKSFKNEDEDKNFSDAKKYLADLIKKLNGEFDEEDVPF